MGKEMGIMETVEAIQHHIPMRAALYGKQRYAMLQRPERMPYTDSLKHQAHSPTLLLILVRITSLQDISSSQLPIMSVSPFNGQQLEIIVGT